MGKRGNWCYQINQAFETGNRIGHSRHRDKAAGREVAGIYSSRTWHDYVSACIPFCRWAKQTYGIKTDVRLLTAEMACAYLDYKAAQGLAGGTLGRIRSALIKLSIALHGLDGRWELGGGWHSDRRPEKAYSSEEAEQIETDLRKNVRDPQIADVVWLCRASGLRRREAIYLRGQDIDVERCRLNLARGTKGGRPRTVPIGPEHQGTLSRLKAQAAGRDDGCVFQGRGGLARRVESAVAAACARLGIERKGIHAFRRTWAQEQYRQRQAQGMEDVQTRRTLSKQLGHGRLEVLSSYISINQIKNKNGDDNE